MKIKIGRYVNTEARQALRLATGINFPGAGFRAEFDGNCIAPNALISIMVEHGLAHEEESDGSYKIFPIESKLPWMLRKQAI